jgi:hypothetical protein
MMSIEEARAIVETRRLIARYVQRVDAKDSDGIAELFTADARIEGLSVGTLDGREAIRAFFAGRGGTPGGPERHHATSIDARLGEDGVVRAGSYLHILGFPNVMAGTYFDELRRGTDGELRFSRKVITLEVS